MDAFDENETVEVMWWGDGGMEARLLHTGLDFAMARARSAYVRGHVSVEHFEAEIERLLRKRAALYAA